MVSGDVRFPSDLIRWIRTIPVAGKLAIGGLILWLGSPWVVSFFLSKFWVYFLVIIGRFLLLLALLFFVFSILGSWKNRILWKIRHRLILAYLFVGVIPTFLILSIVAISGLLIYQQLVYFMLLNQLGQQGAQVESFAQTLRSSLDEWLDTPSINPEQIQRYLERETKFLQAFYPQTSIYLRIEDTSSAMGNALFFAGAIDPVKIQNYRLPAWLMGRNFSGLVFEPLERSHRPRSNPSQADRERNRSNLSLRSVVNANYQQGRQATLEVIVPFDRYMLRRLKEALGVDFFLAKSDQEGDSTAELLPSEVMPLALQKRILASTREISSNQDLERRIRTEAMVLFPVLWENGKESESKWKDNLWAEISFSNLYENLFPSENRYSQVMADVLQFILLSFLAVEVISLLVGIMLTKSITNAVHNLDKGTQRLKQGDFQHHITVKSQDQLGMLAESFNSMSQSLQLLLKERVEKERLDRELEIAKEVQSKLFPKCAPRMQELELCGVCLPARTVSGDFYDYLPFSPHCLGITMGDICGKGISAALLMANLQATIRSYVFSLIPESSRMDSGFVDREMLSLIVSRLNRHVLDFTSASKFATLFCAIFDWESASLIYCNAGHNPPILFRNGESQWLKTGGTIVGMFGDAVYVQEVITLIPGDLFLGYTDGLVEASNEFGEEFGEKRLESVLAENAGMPVDEIHARILQTVQHWTGPKEPEDDMTLIVARYRPECAAETAVESCAVPPNC